MSKTHHRSIDIRVQPYIAVCREFKINVDIPEQLVIDPDQALEYWLDTPFLDPEWRAKHRLDYGPQSSCNQCLRRTPKGQFPGVLESGAFDFGIYAGLHADHGYVVLVRPLVSGHTPAFIGYERYQSLEETKKEWELD